MGWTVRYAGQWPAPLAEADVATFCDHARDPRWRLSRGSEPYRPQLSPDRTGFRGHTKLAGSATPADDYRAIVSALRELDRRLPGATIEISDDYILPPTALADVDLEPLVSQIDASPDTDEQARRIDYERRLDEALAAAMDDPEIAAMGAAARRRIRAQLRREFMDEADFLGLYLRDDE
jgi:hypothetical protein